MSSLNFVDIGILVVFFLSISMGFARGLISEIVSLVTLIAALIIAITFTTALAAVITDSAWVQSIVSESTAKMGASTEQPVSYMALGISFALLFAGTLIVGAIIKSILNLALASGILGVGNRILGGVFGAVRGYLINVVIIFLIQLSPLSTQSWWQQSQFVPYFQASAQWLAKVVSPTLANLKDKISDSVETAL